MSKTLQWIIVWLLVVNLIATIIVWRTNINISRVEDFNKDQIIKQIQEIQETQTEQTTILHIIQAHLGARW